MFRTVRFAALFATATLTAAPALAQTSPVLGTWATAIDLQGTKLESTWIVAQAGGAYTIDIKDGPSPGAPAGAAPPPSTISEVVVEGAKLTFKRALTLDQGPINLAYTINVDGDAMAGEIVSDFGPIAITGTRK